MFVSSPNGADWAHRIRRPSHILLQTWDPEPRRWAVIDIIHHFHFVWAKGDLDHEPPKCIRPNEQHVISNSFVA